MPKVENVRKDDLGNPSKNQTPRLYETAIYEKKSKSFVTKPSFIKNKLRNTLNNDLALSVNFRPLHFK